MGGKKARELHANPLTAPPLKRSRKKDEVPLWKVWRWSLAHPDESPWRDDDGKR